MKLPSVLRRSPVVDLYRALQHPRWERDIWKDYLHTRRTWRALPPPRPGPTKVLLYLWRDDIYEAKVWSLFGRAAGLVGARIEGMVADWKYSRSRRLFRAICGGPATVAPRLEVPLEPAQERLLRNGDYADILGWEVDGIQLGRLVVSSAVRELRNTDPSAVLADRDRLVRLGGKALSQLRSARQILDARPDVRHIIANEPGYVEVGPLVRLALQRGIQVVFPQQSFRDDALLFKRYRELREHFDMPLTVDRTVYHRVAEEPWDAASDRAVEQAFTDRYGGRWQMSNTFSTTTAAEGAITIHPRRRPEKPLVVIFCHVLWDATFWAGDDLFDDYAHWLEETVRAAISIEEVDWVVRTHPANAFRSEQGDVGGCAELRLIREKLPELPPHVHVSLPSDPVTALDCFRHADVGITVRGMPGVEMACFGKRVLTAGTGPYDRLGFTDDFDSREAYLAGLRGLAKAGPVEPERQVRARRYALTLLRDRPFVVESFTIDLPFAKGGTWFPLHRNLHVRPGADFDDLRALGRWLLHSEDADWIAPWHR